MDYSQLKIQQNVNTNYKYKISDNFAFVIPVHISIKINLIRQKGDSSYYYTQFFNKIIC